MRVGAVQLEATPDRSKNLEAAAALVADAAAEGAELVALPEMFGYLGPGREMLAGAEDLEGPTVAWAREQAGTHQVWIVPGSFVERAGDQVFNTTCLVAPSGELVASYRKIHLFDVELADAGLHESNVYTAGTDLVTASVGDVVVGLSVCYDVRFPELYRILTLRGATVVVVPSAFTARTGPDHWELLLRARAVENQVFVIAPDQCGTSADGVARHGHSLIVDPWGRVLADAGSSAGVIVAELDLEGLVDVRTSLPSLANRRPETYNWPTGDRPTG